MKLQTGFDRKRSRFAEWCAAHNLERGTALLFAVLVSLSAIANINFDSASSKIFLSGDIATGDIVADYGFVVKDNRTTERHRAQTRSMQPLICDLMPDGLNSLRHRMQTFFTAINASPSAEAQEQVRTSFAQQVGEEITPALFHSLTQPKTQSMILGEVLPWMDQRFPEGIVAAISANCSDPRAVSLCATCRPARKPCTRSRASNACRYCGSFQPHA
jgi:hypothetical protein